MGSGEYHLETLWIDKIPKANEIFQGEDKSFF